MNIRQSYLSMIRAYEGGWDAMVAALGFKSRDAFENRVYERQGQSILVETALQMQSISKTKHFAEAVAAVSGGVYIELPKAEDADNDALLSKFNQLHAHIGQLSRRFSEATADGEICKRERADLQAISDDIHRAVQELIALTFKIYCRPADKDSV